MNGRVYWITGLSNSGKTTIGTALYYDLKRKGHNVIILDGDLMKKIASGSEKANYEIHDRLVRAKRYSLMAKILADQGIWVIVCAIAMFDEIREWNRSNIKGYIEIFLNPPEAVLRKRDKKRLYDSSYFIGELPKSPDMTFSNDGSLTIRSIVEQIEQSSSLNEDNYDRDREYWNDYYEGLNGQMAEPSNFAIEVDKMLKPCSHIMELGCGNGRDSLYFLSKGHIVTAVDGSDTAIDMLNKITADDEKALFVCDDFVKCHALYQMQYDCVYSRFTLHAIAEDQEDEMLINAKEALSSGGILCIEARTIHDALYGKGKEVGDNAFEYNDHYRRFIDVNEFKKKMENMGFVFDYIEERKGFSKTKESDPMLMRAIARVK